MHVGLSQLHRWEPVTRGVSVDGKVVALATLVEPVPESAGITGFEAEVESEP